MQAIDKYGGKGGIRTLDTVTRMPVFKTGAIDHSATFPLGLEQITYSEAQSKLRCRVFQILGILERNSEALRVL